MKHSLLSLLLLSGCGPAFVVDPQVITATDSEFIPYIAIYVAYKGAALNYSIPIAFSTLEGTTVGLCTKWNSGHRQILIDRYFWNTVKEGEKLEVILHELGHCDLNREHNNSYQSIMYPKAYELDINHMTSYIIELFGR